MLIAAPGDRSRIPQNLRPIHETILEHLNDLKQTIPVSPHSVTGVDHKLRRFDLHLATTETAGG